MKAGIIGMGFIAGSHIDAVRRLGFAEWAAAAGTGTHHELSRQKAEAHYIPRYYESVDDMLLDPEIEVVHNCTANHLHLEMNEKIIKAGKHVFSEKPLAKSVRESERLLSLLQDHPEVTHGMNFNYRMNPLVQEMKHKVRSGQIGQPRLIHGSYLQDWLLLDTDYNWRLDPEFGGDSRAIADIGSHWMDAAQVVIGGKIIEVCADLVTVWPVRKKPATAIETFAVQASASYEEKSIVTEDYGSVLFRMDNGVSGVFYVSQVSAGRKCHFNLEVNGSQASLYWNQEDADRMWMGFRDEDNRSIMRSPNRLHEQARHYSSLPSGHPEGWNDALKNNVYSFYKFVAERKSLKTEACDFATFEDGHYIMKLIEAILESHRSKGWVKV
ncbi:Gfo/Idh/MocA family protein [Cohnella sp.]|uniref:Gfo/Idh/MocA family protein n=1 Tax=Cohnella sp. TaxID=1883426 RepID=UPI0035664D92